MKQKLLLLILKLYDNIYFKLLSAIVKKYSLAILFNLSLKFFINKQFEIINKSFNCFNIMFLLNSISYKYSNFF